MCDSALLRAPGTGQRRELSIELLVRGYLPQLRAMVAGSARIGMRSEGPMPLVHANEGALRRVLHDAVLRASRDLAAPRGEIHIGVSIVAQLRPREEPPVAPGQAVRYVRLTVGDNGPGGAALGLDGMPLQCSEDSDLRMAHAIVTAHGGRISIESHAGAGTVVCVDLPPAGAD